MDKNANKRIRDRFIEVLLREARRRPHYRSHARS